MAAPILIHRFFLTKIVTTFFLLLFGMSPNLSAQSGADAAGTVSGTIVEGGASRPVEFAEVILKKSGDNVVAAQGATDHQGRFALANVPPGDYQLSYGPVGGESKATTPFLLNAQRRTIELGQLDLADTVIQMDKLQVKSKQNTFLNTIDRKVYNVGKEIQSATGSASDLLQNIPSVQVDIDGGVSLRGSESVMILINGRTSVLMGKSRAEVLQQLPADGIEKIEVITNPSAKFKPDGTAGIINIVLKRKQAPGFSGTANMSVGNEERYNGGISSSYNPGTYNLFANLSVRQDDRRRFSSDRRRLVDPVTGVVTTTEKKSEAHSRPLTRIARVGAGYTPDARNTLGATVSYNHRSLVRRGVDRNLARDSSSIVTSDYDRARYAPEFEKSWEFSTTYQHKFLQEDQEINLEFKSSRDRERKDNYYTDSYRTPGRINAYDNTFVKNMEEEAEFIVEYTHPIDEASKLEAGYTGTVEQLDVDFFGETFDPVTGKWVTDTAKTNRFINEETIHAFYLTYGRMFGKFGLRAGLRPELVQVQPQLVSTGTTFTNEYSRVYPSLHLTYHLTEQHEFQLNYSQRVSRPDSDDLNPFPEYSDPFNVRVGNPRLMPENTHSIEAGYGFHGDSANLTAALYHRKLYNGFATITRNIGNGVLLTTTENLSQSDSTGLELTASGELGQHVLLNFSSNTFFNTIDASNLGLSAKKSDVSWLAKVGATFGLPKSTLLQLNTNYVSSRLTTQGSRRPSFVANLGLRRDLWDRKISVLLTVSDLFNSKKEATLLETPTLRQEVVGRHSFRTVYVGMIYRFGKPPKKAKEEQMKFDETL